MIGKQLERIVIQQGGKDHLREIMKRDFGNNLWKVIHMRGFGPVCITFEQGITYSVF
jgi:hypothetical protein